MFTKLIPEYKASISQCIHLALSLFVGLSKTATSIMTKQNITTMDSDTATLTCSYSEMTRPFIYNLEVWPLWSITHFACRKIGTELNHTAVWFHVSLRSHI